MSAAPTPPVLVEHDGDIAVITLNQPAKHNPLSPEVIVRLHAALMQVRDDASIRVAVLTGAGDKAFCAGGDLGRTLPLLTGARLPEDDWDRALVADRTLAEQIALKGLTINKPLIAAVNGHCLAGGMEMLLGTDIRLAVAHATFGLPEPKVGLMPFAGALVRLPQQVGYANAMQMMLTGDAISAEEALRIGLINQIVEPQSLLDEALSVARKIAANAPLAVQMIKQTAVQCQGQTQAQAFEIESQNKDRVLQSADAREGTLAFMEKRQPDFKGD